MTQKSHARKMRDKKKNDAASYINTNKCWDELNSMYSSMCGLLASHANLSIFASNKELVANVIDRDLLATNIRILARDLEVLNLDLSKIHNLHANKSGGTDNPDELMNTIGIFEQYNLFMERHDAVVMPTAYHLIEQFNQAEQIMLAADRVDQNLKDPNVVSDVDYVETKNTSTENVDITSDNVIGSNAKLDFDKLATSFKELHPDTNVEVAVVLGEPK